MSMLSLFLSTLPAWGATRGFSPTRRFYQHFYPRSPRGERPNFPGFSVKRIFHFYPRSPRGERPPADRRQLSTLQFLSTLPAWGATQYFRQGSAYDINFYPRSPRGERHGGYTPDYSDYWNFYPRSPRGERHFYFAFTMFAPNISIHAPRVGSDFLCEASNGCPGISIHAPRVGSDLVCVASCCILQNFYPRSPRGERLIAELSGACII